MTTIAASNLSSFGVINEAEQQILNSEGEEKKTQKASVNDQQKSVQKFHEQRQENIEKRLHMLASGHAGCLKFLKIITMVVSAIAAPVTGGASLGIGGAVVAIIDSLGQLKEAIKQKKLVLNQADGQQILELIQETQKWIDDSKSHLNDSNTRERGALDQYSQQLLDLETSFKTRIQIENK